MFTLIVNSAGVVYLGDRHDERDPLDKKKLGVRYTVLTDNIEIGARGSTQSYRVDIGVARERCARTHGAVAKASCHQEVRRCVQEVGEELDLGILRG